MPLQHYSISINVFDQHPMENLTKAWYYNRTTGSRQRPVEMMRQHRAELGLSGNCFDLALWLLDEFQREGLSAYGVGHNLHSEDAHVAVVALDNNGHRYLCDLGDQWLQPILLDQDSPMFSPEPLSGFFLPPWCRLLRARIIARSVTTDPTGR